MTVNTLTLYMPGSSVGIQVYEGGQLHLILVSQGANSTPSAPGEMARADPFPQYVDDQELAEALVGISSGGSGTSYTDTQAVNAVQAAATVSPAGAWDFAQAPTVGGVPVGSGGGGGSPTIATLPAGSMVYVNQNSDGTWPNRLTPRTDIKQVWIKTVSGSSDPDAATAPALTGAYPNDLVVGV